jgi:hypothetical protein
MKLFLIGFLGAALVLTAQVPRAAVRINPPNVAGHATNQVGTAILGFTAGPASLQLSAILGVFGAARISQPIAVPETVTRLYLSARQRYALVEQNSAGPLAVWNLDETLLLDRKPGADGLVAIAGALSHPDLVAFSPRGESVALYVSASRQLQVIAGMPNKAFIKKTPPLESPATITMIAVSDDASVVVTKDSAGDLQVSSDDTSWRPVYGAYSPLAWSFIPRTHDLIVSDSQENAVFLIEQADSKNTRAVLAENCLPDQLAVTSAGEILAALDSKRSILWTIDLKNRGSNVTTSAQNLNSLTILRNGNTFLASSRSAGPTLLKISEDAAVQTAALGGR